MQASTWDMKMSDFQNLSETQSMEQTAYVWECGI